MYPIKYAYKIDIYPKRNVIHIWINLYDVDDYTIEKLKSEYPRPLEIKVLRGNKYILKYEIDEERMKKLLGVL